MNPRHDRDVGLQGILISLVVTLLVFAGSAFPGEASSFVTHRCRQMTLPDGRRLAYAEYGDPAGTHVVLYHHGMPSCRLEAERLLCALSQHPGVRLIALDRPGIGRSDPDCCGDFHSWARDVKFFTTALGIQKFSLIGVSGGTPYALATARMLPESVIAVALACPIAPIEGAGRGGSEGAQNVLFAERHPFLARLAVNAQRRALQRRPERRTLSMLTMPPADRAVLSSAADRRAHAEIIVEAMCQGTHSIIRAGQLLAQPWSCWLPEVRCKVTILHGCEDRITSPRMAAYLASVLPNSEVRFYPGQGHPSLVVNCSADILRAALAGKE